MADTAIYIPPVEIKRLVHAVQPVLPECLRIGCRSLNISASPGMPERDFENIFIEYNPFPPFLLYCMKLTSLS